MAPITRSRADNSEHAPTKELQGEYYRQRASAGLIILTKSHIYSGKSYYYRYRSH